MKDSLNSKAPGQDWREKRMQAPHTPLIRPVFSYEEMEQVRQVLKSGWTTKGPRAHEFERIVGEYFGARNVIAVTNCTSALHLALMAFGVTWGDNVVISDYTFPATGFAVRYTGASVIHCDVDPNTYNMSPKHFEMLCRKYNPKAAIVVHAFGQCADMDEIMNIARIYDVKVIEDAACALGAKYKGRPAGTLGDIGCFSLHARKGITTGEGGLIMTNDDRLAEEMRRRSEFGVSSTWGRNQEIFSLPQFHILGYNYKMSDITAGIGIAQMGKLKEIIGHKREAADRYARMLPQKLPFLTAPVEGFGNFHVYQAYVPLLKPEYAVLRDWVIQQFLDNRIGCTIGTYALHREPYFQSPTNVCPVSGDLFDRAIALPIYFKIGLKHISNIGEKIAKEIDGQLARMNRSLKARMPKKKKKEGEMQNGE